MAKHSVTEKQCEQVIKTDEKTPEKEFKLDRANIANQLVSLLDGSYISYHSLVIVLLC